jgi:hypothetical protein
VAELIEADLDLLRCLIHFPADFEEMERMEREVELLRDLDGSRGESHPAELPVDGRWSGMGDLLFPRGNMLVTVERLKRGRRYDEEPREGGGSVDMTISDISIRNREICVKFRSQGLVLSWESVQDVQADVKGWCDSKRPGE